MPEFFNKFYVPDINRDGVVLEKIGIKLGERTLVFATGKAFGYEGDTFVFRCREKLAPLHHFVLLRSASLEGRIILDLEDRTTLSLPEKSIHDVLLTDLGIRASRQMLDKQERLPRIKISKSSLGTNIREIALFMKDGVATKTRDSISKLLLIHRE